MNLLTALHEIVSQLRSRRHQTHGGAHAADKNSETNVRELMIENPETWHAGQELEKRAEEVERVESTVRIIGSSGEEWIEGPAMEVRR